MLNAVGGAGPAWLIAALVLGLAELLLPGVFLVFLALAAAITGVISYVLPDLSGPAQLGAFALWSVVAVLIGLRWYRDYAPDGADAALNEPALRLVGATATVEQAIVGGYGRVRIGDGSWSARGPDAPVGAAMRVVAIDSGVAVVEPV